MGPAALKTAEAASSRRGRFVTSTLCYVLAYNLVFFTQELFLVLPKAFTPGLRPTLFHNNHDWTGHHPLENLFQGTGALATLVLGTAAWTWLARHRQADATWRLLAAWIAFHGCFEALPQFVIGAFVPANDVGRAMDWFALAAGSKAALAIAAVVAMGVVARGLVVEFVAVDSRSPARSVFVMATLPAVLASLLVLPYRMPGAWIEVAIVPLFAFACGIPAMQLWAFTVKEGRAASFATARPLGPLAGCLAVLLIFQVGLRRGIDFF